MSGFRIADGLGNGFKAGVNKAFRLMVNAETNLSGFFASRDKQDAYNLISIDSGPTAADYICYLKNTSATQDVYIDLIRVSGIATALWKVFKVTGTAAGTTITPVNLNVKSSKDAEATCFGSNAVTGLTTGEQIALIRNAANAAATIPFDDMLILGTNDAIAIEHDTGAASSAEVLIRFFYETR